MNLITTSEEKETHEKTAGAAEFWYLAFIAILAFVKAIGFYEGQTVFTIALVIACCCMLVKIGMTEHTALEYAVIAVLLGTGLLVYLNSGEKVVFINFLLIVGLKGVSARKAMQTWLMSFGIGFAGLFLVSMLGLHFDQLYLQEKVFLGMVLRHCMGYTMPSVLQASMLCVCALVLYLAEDRFSKRQKLALAALMSVLNIYIFTYSMALTGFAATFILLIFYVYFTLREKLSSVEKVLAQLVLPLCLLLTMIGPLLPDGRLFNICNKLLNGRYALMKYFYTEQPVTLFGTRFNLPEGYTTTLDSSFSYLFMYHGIISFVIFIMLYGASIHRMVNRNRLTELSIMLALCVAGLSEQFLFNFSFKNIAMIFFGEYLYELLGNLEQRKGGKFLSRRYKILHFRERAIYGRIADICEKWCSACREILAIWIMNWQKYVVLLTIIGLIFGGGYCLWKGRVDTLYIGEESISGDQGTLYYLNREVMEQENRNGAIFLGYVDENEGMYRFTGNIVILEYMKQIVSIILWCGTAGCVIAAYMERRRMRHSDA